MENLGSMLGLDQATQEKLQVDKQKYVSKAMKLIHSVETREQTKEKLKKPGNPVEVVADAAAEIMGRIDEAARQEGYEAHDMAKMEAGQDIVREVAEIGVASGAVPEMSEDQIMAAYSVATEKYLASEIQAGRIDPDKLKAEFGEGMSTLSPEQQQEIDQQTIKIGKTATGGTTV